MDVPVQSIPLLHPPHRKQSRRVEDISGKVALDQNHVRIRGLGLGGEEGGGKGTEYKTLQQMQTEACRVFGKANASLPCLG